MLRAARADPFDAYRFDGLDRWTHEDARERYESRRSLIEKPERPRTPDVDFASGVLLSTQDDVAVGMRAASDYYRSSEFHTAMAAVLAHLR